MIKFIRERRKAQECKRTNRRRKRIRSMVSEMRKEKNNGRLHRLLLEFPSAAQVSVNSGGFRDARCYLQLRSGHEFVGYGFHVANAIRNCAAKVALYLWRDL